MTWASEPADSITGALSRLGDGGQQAFDQLVRLVYPDLRRIAEGYLRRERPDHTLQPTALVHEAYLKLIGYDASGCRNRKHFFAVAARVMRRILVDHARSRMAAKRGAGLRAPFELETEIARGQEEVLLSLNEALTKLAKQDEAKARLVEMRFFGGMTAEEIAECVEAPTHAVRRDLRMAQSWLRREIEA